MNAKEIEERFIALEMLAAEYERTVKELNQIVAEQAMTIDRLQKNVLYLMQNFDAGGVVRPLSEEVPPPHY